MIKAIRGRVKFSTPAGLFLWIEGAALLTVGLVFGATWLIPVVSLVLLFAALLSSGVAIATIAAAAGAVWWSAQGARGAEIGILPSAYAVVAVLVSIACAFAIILSGLRSGWTLREGKLGRLVVMLHVAITGILLAAAKLPVAAQWLIAWGCTVIDALLVLDLCCCALERLYTTRDQWSLLRKPGVFLFFRWLGPEWKGCLPQPEDREDHLLRLSEMWMWPIVRRGLLPLALSAVLVAWIGTAFHEIESGSCGIRERFGVMEDSALEPGLHCSLPWPFGDVRTVDTGTVRQIVLGFRADSGKPILWERPHYVDEELSLVGGGDDFLSISVPILYRVSDPRAYLLSASSGEDLLKNLARRSLLKLTLHRPAAEIITTSRDILSEQLKSDLQRELDERHCGLMVCEVCFRDIHPPVAVAPAFQDVVSAMEDKEALIHEGEEYRVDRLVTIKGETRELVINAEALAIDRLKKADGEAKRFASKSEAHAQNPALYELREGYANFDRTLAVAKKAVFDDKMLGQIPAHLDLRRILNPKLIDNAPPAPESLIPDSLRKPETFNLNVEGYH